MRKLRNALAIASVAAGVAAVAYADQFVLDVPFAELKKREGEILLSDLMVGDTARTKAEYAFCGDENGHLFIRGNLSLGAESSEWSDALEVRMLPGREVDVTLEVRDRDRRTTTPDARAIKILTQSTGTCEYETFERPATLRLNDFELLRVRTINGHERLSDLFE